MKATSTTLSDIQKLIEWPDEPCEYEVFRNGVLLMDRELDLYADYEVEMISTRLQGRVGEEKPYIVIYLR